MIDCSPAAIVRCAGAADVIAAVNFARDHKLVLAVRGGGHSAAGSSVCDRGLMIDLSLMTGIRADPARRTARAEPGVTWAEFDRETQAFGLATTGGVVSTSGIAGLTLGGGIGWLGRTHGLSCDNSVSVDVVTADGKLRTGSAEENADLFWALRGGGGNFGVVTPFEYRPTMWDPQSWRDCWCGRDPWPATSCACSASSPTERLRMPAPMPGWEQRPMERPSRSSSLSITARLRRAKRCSGRRGPSGHLLPT